MRSSCVSLLTVEPGKAISPGTIFVVISVYTVLIAVSYGYSFFQATETLRTLWVGIDGILAKANITYNASDPEDVHAANQLVLGSVAIASSTMAIGNRVATLPIISMRRYLGEVIGKYQSGNLTLKQQLQAYMRNGITLGTLMAAIEAIFLIYGAKMLFALICDDAQQALLASITMDNIWPGAGLLVFQMLMEQFTLQKSVKMILTIAILCMTTLVIGAMASVLLGKQFGFAGMAWGFDLQTVMTVSCFIGLLGWHPELKDYRLFAFYQLAWRHHWELMLPVLKFTFIRFVSAIHEAAIPLMITLIAAAKSAEDAANYNAALQLYNYMRIVILAFEAALYAFVPKMKGALMAVENDEIKKIMIIKNIQRAISIGLLTVFGISVLVATVIYMLVAKLTPGLTDDGLYLLRWYAGIGLLIALDNNMGALLSMMNNTLHALNTGISVFFSWGALIIFAVCFSQGIMDFKQVGPTFFLAHLLKVVILSIPLIGFRNAPVVERAILNKPKSDGDRHNGCCKTDMWAWERGSNKVLAVDGFSFPPVIGNPEFNHSLLDPSA